MQSQALDPAVVPELGKYHLVAELARGGMGIIHLAVAHGLAGFNKLLVVKELKPELSRDESYVSMFLDEARLAARLEHRNIVQTIEVGSEGTRHNMET
jgi:serine/threonine-protein kinase